LTVKVPENAKPLMTIPPDACDPLAAAAGLAAAEGAGVVLVVVDDELQDARRMERAAAAVSAYGFIPMITDANPAWFTPCVGGHPAQPR